MDTTEGAADHELRQMRLSRFGRVLACVTLGWVGLITFMTIYVGRLAFMRQSVPLLVAAAAFVALWLLLRGGPRTPRFVRTVELSTLFVGTTAFSTMALILDLTASPDMVVRSALTYMLLVYAVYVPSTARHTLVVAGLMTVPLLGCIFIAFRSWDPALYDPPAAIWPKGRVGDMAYPATVASSLIWGIAVAMAAGFSQTIYGLRKAVKDIRRLGKSVVEVCAHHLHSVPELPSTRLGAPVAPDLEVLLLACLAKRPEDRPASAHVLRERLRACEAAGRWTNARAAEWWAGHRHELRSGGAGATRPTASAAASAHHLTITRIAD